MESDALVGAPFDPTLPFESLFVELFGVGDGEEGLLPSGASQAPSHTLKSSNLQAKH
jgi:hypothetical protein